MSPSQLANVRESPEQVSIRVAGDWDDLGAAVGIGLGKLNLAVVDVQGTPESGWEYSLVDVMDRPARLTVRRMAAADPTDPTDPTEIEISARFTRFRDMRRERLLVAAIAQRFDELRGVDVAPVR